MKYKVLDKNDVREEEDKYFIAKIHISPAIRDGQTIKFDTSYPEIYCIINPEKQIAIDIENELQYDYIETCSRLYFLNQSYELIKDNKRVAVFPYASILIPDEVKFKARKIAEKVSNGEEILDGNEAIPNELYSKFVKSSVDDNGLKDINKINTLIQYVLKNGKNILGDNCEISDELYSEIVNNSINDNILNRVVCFNKQKKKSLKRGK